MFHLFGFMLGICCGAIELYLLRLFVNSAISRQSVPFWIPPVKFFILIAFGLPLARFSPEQLPAFGLGAAAVMVLGALAGFVLKVRRKNETEPKKEDCV